MNQLKSRWESGPAGSKPTLQTAESLPQTASLSEALIPLANIGQ